MYLRYSQEIYKIKQYCKKHRFDTSLSFMEESNFSNILSKLYGNNSKIIVSIRQSTHAWNLGYKFLIKLLYWFSNKIITVSQEEKKNLEQTYGIWKHKIQTIYNPIDIAKINKLKTKSLWKHQFLLDLKQSIWLFFNWIW